jgi:hypothetical protein
MWSKHTESRYLNKDFPISLPHERFFELLEQRPADFNTVDINDLPGTYASHPVVLERGHADTVPLTLYSDGVPFSKTDSFICWYWSSAVDPNRKRHLICTVKKSDLCQCSCKGWCTMQVIQKVIAWSFSALAAGTFPPLDHNQKPFSQELRELHRGLPFGKYGALVEYRADLLEYVSCFGFTNWTHVQHPCFCCNASRADMFNFARTLALCPWRPRQRSDFNDDLGACVTKRYVQSRAQLRRLLRCMELSRKYGGFALVRPFPELHLPVGWIVICDENLLDWHALVGTGGSIGVDMPGWLTFFNAANTSNIKFWSPLFTIRGFSVDCLHLDFMHVFDLDISQYVAGEVMLKLIDAKFAQSAEERGPARMPSSQPTCSSHF